MKKMILCLILLLSILVGCSDLENKKEEYQVALVKAQHLLDKDSCYNYYYEKLSNLEKDIYTLVYYGMKHGDKVFYTKSDDSDRVEEIISYVTYDHPELFYVSATTAVQKEDDVTKVVVAYNENNKIRKDRNEQLQQTWEELSAQINDSMSEYDKVKLVYDYVITRDEYVENAKNNQNVISALVDKQTVCAGYAKAVQYLLNKLGIPTSYITGEILDVEEGENASHAWNLVKVDGNFYYLDATWGDQVSDEGSHICYSYFMMSEAETKRIYKADVAVEQSHKEDNYFIRTKTYVDMYTEANVTSALANALANSNQTYLEIKLSKDAYTLATTQLFNEDSKIFNLLEQIGRYDENITYIFDDQMYVIEIYF